MNMLFLMVQRIKQYYMKNRLVFLLFVIGGIINAIVLVYSYGNLLPVVRNRESDHVTYRQYTVSFRDPNLGSLEEIAPLRQNELIESLMASCRIPAENLGSKGGAYYLVAYDEAYPTPVAAGTNQFTGEDQVLAPINCMKEIGDQVSLFGKNYTIIGKLQVLDEYFIPWETFAKLERAGAIARVQIVSKERHSYKNDPVIELINEKLPNNAKATGMNATLEKTENNRTAAEYPDILMVYLVSTLSYMFLLRHLVDSIMDENIISAFVGASRATITVMVFWETMVLTLFSNGIGFLLHAALYQLLFTKINIADDLTYYSGDYLTLMVVVFVISLAVAIPFVAKYMRMSPVSAKREHV